MVVAQICFPLAPESLGCGTSFSSFFQGMPSISFIFRFENGRGDTIFDF